MRPRREAQIHTKRAKISTRDICGGPSGGIFIVYIYYWKFFLVILLLANLYLEVNWKLNMLIESLPYQYKSRLITMSPCLRIPCTSWTEPTRIPYYHTLARQGVLYSTSTSSFLFTYPCTHLSVTCQQHAPAASMITSCNVRAATAGQTGDGWPSTIPCCGLARI